MSSVNYYPTPRSPEMATSRTTALFDQHNQQSAARESPQQSSLPTPPSATTSNNNSPYSPDGQFKVVRKRNRVPLSCAPCRNRKLKCNRSHPCENCVKRGDSMSCSYAQPSSRKRQTPSTASSNTPTDMQNRIDRLEGLVLSLMTNGSQSAGPSAAQRALSMDSSANSQQQDLDLSSPDTNGMGIRGEGSEESETDTVAQSLGVMKVDNNKSMYYGGGHWATILSDLAEVKNYFNDQQHRKQMEDQMQKISTTKARLDGRAAGPMFLLGGNRVPEMSEVLAQMPKRTVADKLVARYFNSYDPAVHILHPPTWLKIYDKYWQNPEAAHPVWLGQMYAIFCLAMNSYDQLGDEPPEYRGKSRAMASHYRQLSGQSILLADFTKPIFHMIETLVLNLHCEYARSRDTEVGVWVLAGMVVRLAMRMGYHRDPKYYSNISPFQGEIRRRVWTFVRSSDLLFSFQAGLPSMIREGDCDTELPRNLMDEELDENMEHLPESRPSAEPTQVSYMRAKASMVFVFGKITERLHLAEHISYEEIISLDQQLRQSLADLPPHLRMRSLEDSANDPGALIMQRFNLEILYHKGQVVLHRKFATRARKISRYADSRRTCIDSAMALLRIQETLHFEGRTGHRLHGMRPLISSLTANDFLQACTVVAWDVCCSIDINDDNGPAGDNYLWGREIRTDMMRALEMSQSIWKETLDESIESYKADRLLHILLTKMRAGMSQNRNTQNLFPFLPMGNVGENNQAFGATLEEKPEHSAAMTLGMLSSGGMGTNANPQFNNGAFPTGADGAPMASMQGSSDPTAGFMNELNNAASGPNAMGFFDGAIMPGMDMSDGEPTIDWDAWDSYVQNANIEPPPIQQTPTPQPQQQQQQQQPQQPWPASVDPSLATSAIDGGPQQTLNAPNAFMGGNMPM